MLRTQISFLFRQIQAIKYNVSDSSKYTVLNTIVRGGGSDKVLWNQHPKEVT